MVYKNGILSDTASVSSGSITATSDLTIGRHRAGEYFSGLIDDPRIYNRALNATEVGALYKNTAGYYTTGTLIPNAQNKTLTEDLIARYTFDAGDFRDASSNVRTGTLIGGVLTYLPAAKIGTGVRFLNPTAGTGVYVSLASQTGTWGADISVSTRIRTTSSFDAGIAEPILGDYGGVSSLGNGQVFGLDGGAVKFVVSELAGTNDPTCEDEMVTIV